MAEAYLVDEDTAIAAEVAGAGNVVEDSTDEGIRTGAEELDAVEKSKSLEWQLCSSRPQAL